MLNLSLRRSIISKASSNYHIMVVDTNPNQVVTTILGSQGYHISHLFGVRQALSELSITNKKPDLILCDLSGQETDGLEFLREVRNPRYPKIPIMIITALESNANFEKAVVDLGADDFVVTPIRASELLLRVRLLLRGLSWFAA